MERAETVMAGTSAAPRRVARGEKTRQDILAVAVQLASVEGLEDLTIGRLADELKMSKSGLFAHFGSKEDLQLAAIETARAIFIEEVVRPVWATEPGLARLRALLEAWISYGERGVFRGGCFFAAASTEFDGRPGRVRDEVVAVNKSWLEALGNEVRAAQSRSELNQKIDPEQIVFEIHAFYMEMNWGSQLFGDKRMFARARAAMRRRLEDAATPKGLALLRSKPKAQRKAKSKRS